jgi:alcohol dehydrogenase class IV
MRAPAGDALSRYAVVAQLLTGDPAATPGDAINWLRRLVADLQIPGLGLYGVDQALITELVQNASRASSMKANPVELSRDELAAIVNEAL